MRTTLYLLLAAMCILPAVVVAEANSMTCSVSILDTHRVLKPRNTSGRIFSTFTLDLSQDPHSVWQHQNFCAYARDFKGASFKGALCLVVMTGAESIMTGAESTDPSEPVLLSVDLFRLTESSSKNASSRALLDWQNNGSSTLLVPIDPRGRSLQVQQSFTTKGSRGELLSANISCSR